MSKSQNKEIYLLQQEFHKLDIILPVWIHFNEVINHLLQGSKNNLITISYPMVSMDS